MVDEDEGLARVRAASSSADLHRLLITGHLSARSADYREAAGLLRQFHADDVRGVADTAVLLMLSERWHPHTAKMIADLVASGILTGEALDEVAQRLLWPDRPTWTHPSSWFGLEIPVGPEPSRSSRQGTSPDRLVRTALPAPRGVVRRWAATRLLRRGLTDVDSVEHDARGSRHTTPTRWLQGSSRPSTTCQSTSRPEPSRSVWLPATATPGCSRSRRCMSERGLTLWSAALNRILLPGSAPGQPRSPEASSSP